MKSGNIKTRASVAGITDSTIRADPAIFGNARVQVSTLGASFTNRASNFAESPVSARRGVGQMDSADRRASARRAGTRLADLFETSMARFAFLLAGCVLAAAPFLDLSPELQTLLTRELSFSADDLSDLARGKVVHHSLKTVTVGEVAAVGAIRIEAPKEHFIRAYRDITRFKQGPGVLQIGRFSDPPAPADLAALTIEREDADLRNCRVGDCDIRRPAEVIARFQREIDWTARDDGARVAALFREVL